MVDREFAREEFYAHTSADGTPMLQRNLLYTGVTRAKRLVVLVGQKKAVAIAVRNISGRRRWSKLGERLATPTTKTFAIVASPRVKGSAVQR